MLGNLQIPLLTNKLVVSFVVLLHGKEYLYQIRVCRLIRSRSQRSGLGNVAESNGEIVVLDDVQDGSWDWSAAFCSVTSFVFPPIMEEIGQHCPRSMISKTAWTHR